MQELPFLPDSRVPPHLRGGRCRQPGVGEFLGSRLPRTPPLTTDLSISTPQSTPTLRVSRDSSFRGERLAEVFLA